MSQLYIPDPNAISRSNMARFSQQFGRTLDIDLSDYRSLHRASLEHKALFWREIWDFAEVTGDPGDVTLRDDERMPGARWFPEAELNFAENLLGQRSDAPAIVFRGEDRLRITMSRAELHDAVSSTAQALAAVGVRKGDRVAGMLPNLPEAIVAMLATTSLGAVWSSCSPDFGVDGVVDRFGQIEPKVLFAVDGYFYRGKVHDCTRKVAEIAARLGTLERLVLVSYAPVDVDATLATTAVRFDAFLAPFPAQPLKLERFPFDHPLYIVFSSGTTGVPKCIVHGAGGTLLQHLKEHQLHTDVKPEDRLFYFTTCGWMMWNWLASGLASAATLMLYDGNPFYPHAESLFDFAVDERIRIFGASAKFLETAFKQGLRPGESHDLSALDIVLSTGSPLTEELFDYVYQHIKPDVQLSSIAGGTDIISCFVLGAPVLPVRRGEIQCAGLGMAVEVWDDAGRAVSETKGELVCTEPFPSMPIGFWNDPDGCRYSAAYFERFPGVWHHGDFALKTAEGGFVIYGRSDAVLNPGGVRIGTAEIYRQVDLVPEVEDAIVVGQTWQGDVRVVLFVKLQAGEDFSESLSERIKQRIRDHATPRHVPAIIVPVPDIPRTRSGKLVELAVREVVHGRPVLNQEAIENPECLDFFSGLPELS
jgi:acetoacetyl-CoA synthetase